jgi:iron complex transport system substrate-binding protein
MKSLALFMLSCLLYACESSVKKDIEQAPLISLVYTDDTGRELHFETAPKRLISLAPSITEMIYYLEAEDCLLATSQACNYPSEGITKSKVQTYPELDTETILSLKPDLILATSEIFSPEIGPWFHQYQIPVLFQQYTRLEDIFRNMEALTQLIACKPNSPDKIASLRRVCDSVQTRHENAVRHKVMILVNAAPLCIAGKTSFMQDLIRTAGGQNIGESLDQAYPEVTSEFLIQQNPDFILLPAKDEASALEFIIQHPELNRLKAISEKRLILVDPDIYLRPGPRSIDALIELATLLHPGE